MNKNSFAKLAFSGLVAGGMMLVACEKSSTAPAETTKATLTSAKTAAEFKQACLDSGRVAEPHGCSGAAGGSCAGIAFESKTGEIKAHDCAGHASCEGVNCKDKPKP